MPKAESNGVYIQNGMRYIVTKGQPYPDGAEFEAVVEPDPEERALKGAPENKARQAAPETKSKSSKKDE